MTAILKSRLGRWKVKQKNKELTCFETFGSNRNFFLEIGTVVMLLVCGAVNKYWNKRYYITISRANYKRLPIIPTSLMLATEIEKESHDRSQRISPPSKVRCTNNRPRLPCLIGTLFSALESGRPDSWKIRSTLFWTLVFQIRAILKDQDNPQKHQKVN